MSLRAFTAAVAFLVPFSAFAEGRSFAFSSLDDEAASARFLWEHAPSLADERAQVARADAGVDLALIRPNPELGFEVGTLTLGETNPSEINRFTEIPNYTVELSVPLELGKRSKRRAAATHERQAAVFEARQAVREAVVELRKIAAVVASAQWREALLAELEADAGRMTTLEKRRLGLGASTGIDADRAALEEAQLAMQRAEATDEKNEALVECAELVGAPCVEFASAEDARRYLLQLAPIRQADGEDRPDLRAFQAREQAAQAHRSLARAQAIPDPTVHLAYVHDRFEIGDNQRHSLNFGVSLPLPVFDAGRADAKAAEADVLEAVVGHERTRRQQQAAAERLRLRADALERKLATLREVSLPLARSVVERLEQALAAGGADLADLVLSRQALVELELGASQMAASLHQTRTELAFVTGAGPLVPDDLVDPKENR